MNQPTNRFPALIKFFDGDKRWYALLVVVLTLVVNLIRIARDVVPGDSAQLVAQHAGYDVFAPLSHVVWGWAGRIFGLFPFGSAAFGWNLLSAVSGAAVCGMLFLLVRRLIGKRDDKFFIGGDLYAYRNLAGLTASLLLAFCQPFHLISTMANPITFELLLLLLSIWLLARFNDTGLLRFGAGALALYGVTMTQYAAAIMLSPLFGIMALYIAWRKNFCRPAPMTRLVLSFAVGPALALMIALLFMQKSGYQWAEMQGIGQVLWFMARDLYLDIRSATPLIAIILISIYSILPFLCIVVMPKQLAISYYTLMLICAVISALLFLNFRFAPWPMFGFRPLLILPYVIAAAWSGSLIAYVMGLIGSNWLFRFHYSRSKWLQPTLSFTWLLLVGALITGAGWSSLRNEGISSSQGVALYADYMAGQLNDDTWVIVDRQLEPVLRIKCAENGRRPFIISHSRMNHRPYLNALAHQLNDPRLASMAEMGLIPLLRERLEHSQAPAPVIAVAGDSGILRFVAGNAWPDRTLYTTQRQDAETIDWAEYMDVLRAWWRKLPLEETPGPFSDLINRLHVQSARIANDTGIILENSGKVDFAREAFREAIRIHPQNLSAHLNLRALLPDGPEAELLEEEIERLSITWRGRASLVQIMDVHGMIRHEAASYSADQRWGRADSTSRMDERMLQLLNLEDEEEAFRQAMTMNGGEIGTKLAIARLAAGKNRTELARKILLALNSRGEHEQAVLLELATIDIQMGQSDRAYRTLSAIPESEITDPRILILLASLTIESNPEDCDRYLYRLESFPNLLTALELPIARIYESRGNLTMAIRHLTNLIARQPLNQDALQMIVRLHLDQGDVPEAIPFAKQLFSLNPRHPIANAALALHLEARDNKAAAETARMIAISGDPVLSVYFE